MMKLLSVLATVMGLSLTANAVEVPKTFEGATNVKIATAAEVKDILAKGGKCYDVRLKSEYVEGHIPGCQFVPYTEKSKKEAVFDSKDDAWDITKLDANKDGHYVFICNGIECWKSFKTIHWVNKHAPGYKNLYWFRGGWPEWAASGNPIEK